ncbi:urate hydroxylase PuuD [Pseudomaricurvus alkylphenolicus]|uniref:urate hydroxylase PuuD n=1 Tax=Pseudomaricurvus alkylphenolicus TaxID=1306991 RepID=UPI00141F8244|nr:urate hydroxylase PuuD [Pseudomaricurvus alkylphenolicus]
MDPYLTEWLNLILRFAHVITGIAWIGASFYFVWLDNSLETPPKEKADKGIRGDLWAIHGGGFYEVAKYKLAPPAMPQHLHWFKWEAYTTWITGFLLLTLMYYVGAEAYLIDPRIAELSQMEAIAIGLGSIIGGWFVYDGLCRTKLADHGLALGLILLALATGLAWFLTEVFSARGAYIHMGAVIGTIMAGNVFSTIMPGQRALVEAVEKGEAPDSSWAMKAKLRSTHNTYTTLPLIFIMISNHYPMTYNHGYNWLVLMIIFAITAAIRVFFVARHTGKQNPALLVGAGLATIALAVMIAPKSVTPPAGHEHSVSNVDVTKVETILTARCGTCHSSAPTDDMFTTPPGGVTFDNMTAMKQWAPRIKARTVDSTDMPFMNKTHMTDEERQYIALWVAQGAPEH